MASAKIDDHENQLKIFREAPPSVPHQVLTLEEIGSKEVFVIGDVHGCYDELVSLLKEAGVRDNANAIVILAGDLINKGPKSKEVLNLVREIGALCVRGNHDQKCLYRLLQYKKDKTQILEEKYEWLLQLDKNKYIKLLSEMPYTISIPSLNAVVVHAGLVPGRPLTQQEPWDMMIMRNLIVKRSKSTGELRYKAKQHHAAGEPWSTVWEGPEHVYYGHDARRGLNQCAYATGLDTGCVYGRHLTGVFLTGDKRVVEVRGYDVETISKKTSTVSWCSII